MKANRLMVQIKTEVKGRITSSATGGSGAEGPRSHTQVLANSLIASCLILLHTWRLSGSIRDSQCWDVRHPDLLVIGIVVYVTKPL